MNLLFTVCGRAGSKGCKNKNIKEFMGRPLFYYTLNTIELYKKSILHNIFIAISTDSVDFIDLVKKSKYSEVFVINRDKNLAGENTAKMDVIRDALLKSETHFKKDMDLIIDLDITSPIRTVKDLTKAIDKAIKIESASCVFSVTKARRNPYFNMVRVENDGLYKVLESDFTSRQQAPTMFDMNASIYVYKRAFLLSNSKSPINIDAKIIEMKDTGIIDIDDEEDFALMEIIAKYLSSNEEDYSEIFKF